MSKVLIGQVLLVLCCGVYLLWWYLGYRPGTHVNRIGGINGVLLLITAVLGLAGVIMSLMSVPQTGQVRLGTGVITAAGIALYFVLLLITRFGFDRIVTTELALITGWATLEMIVLTRLEAARAFGQGSFVFLCVVLTAAVLVSMILYVAYYKMEEMKAFYAAMVPLMTEAAAMIILIVVTLRSAPNVRM